MNMRAKDAFAVYCRFRAECQDGVDFCPFPVETPALSSRPVIEAFIAAENGESDLSCDDPTALKVALEGKSLLNLHVTDLWKFQVHDASLVSLFTAWATILEMAIAMPYLPKWVWKTLWKLSCGDHEFFYLNPYETMVAKFGMPLRTP